MDIFIAYINDPTAHVLFHRGCSGFSSGLLGPEDSSCYGSSKLSGTDIEIEIREPFFPLFLVTVSCHLSSMEEEAICFYIYTAGESLSPLRRGKYFLLLYQSCIILIGLLECGVDEDKEVDGFWQLAKAWVNCYLTLS